MEIWFGKTAPFMLVCRTSQGRSNMQNLRNGRWFIFNEEHFTKWIENKASQLSLVKVFTEKTLWHFLLGNQFAISKSKCFDIRPRTRVLELLVFRISYRLLITFPRAPNLMSHDIEDFPSFCREKSPIFCLPNNLLTGYIYLRRRNSNFRFLTRYLHCHPI